MSPLSSATTINSRFIAGSGAGEEASDAGADMVVLTRSLIANFRNLLVARIDPELLARDLAPVGLLGMQLSGYGCPGRSAVEYGLAALELEAGDSGLRSFASVQSALAMYSIYASGSEAQKRRYLP